MHRLAIDQSPLHPHPSTVSMNLSFEITAAWVGVVLETQNTAGAYPEFWSCRARGERSESWWGFQGAEPPKLSDFCKNGSRFEMENASLATLLVLNWNPWISSNFNQNTVTVTNWRVQNNYWKTDLKSIRLFLLLYHKYPAPWAYQFQSHASWTSVLDRTIERVLCIFYPAAPLTPTLFFVFIL